jgi:tRNA dimethylallyltransferase
MQSDAVLIAGPTASGKSAASLVLAEYIGGALINADAMQVYKEAPILTAQPDAATRARAPHLLYGHASVHQTYSVGRYIEDARQALDAVRAMGKVPIFVGGTGLYFTALTVGLAAIPPVPAEIRSKARALLDEIGVDELHARLSARDPAMAAMLRPTDPQRVVRAWEVLEATGRSLLHWQEQKVPPPLQGLRLARFVLDPPRALLHQRIAQRFQMMLKEGGLSEAKALSHLDPAFPAAKLLGLRPLIAYARGQLSKDEAIAKAVSATRQFAKRQFTWFRHRMTDYIWFDPEISNIIVKYKHFIA